MAYQGDYCSRQVGLFETMVKEDSNIPIEEDRRKKLFSRQKIELSMNDLMESWSVSNGVHYYHKRIRNLNEFIGEALALKLGLKSAHYEPVYYKGMLMQRTPDFKEKGYSYKSLFELNLPIESDINNFVNYFNLKEDDLNNILKLYAVDIFMRQNDRCEYNLTLKRNIETGAVSFAPIYDYTDSFYPDFDVYYNYIMDLEMQKDVVFKKMKKYPMFYEYLKEILDTELMELIEDFAIKYNLKVTDEVKDFYGPEEIKSKKLIKKIM